MNRKLTQKETDWLKQGLATLQTGEYFGGGRWIDIETDETKPLDESIDNKFFLDQIETLRVVYECECGQSNCHTVHFQHFEKGKSVAIVSSSTDDKRMLIILINEDTGCLSELEII
jgi:hypothetical protein